MVMRMGYSERGEHDKDRNFSFSKKGTYGTSEFMSEKEMAKLLDVTDPKHCTGIILGETKDGKVVSIPEDSYFQRNAVVLGASGSMKSRTWARCRALQGIRLGESLIFCDPKSELYSDLSEYCRSQGYTVRVFNLVSPENSDSWACIQEIEGSEFMAQIFCDVIIKNTGGEKDDQFWANGEKNLLKALCLYTEFGNPDPYRNFGQVMDLIMLGDEFGLNKLFDVLPVTHPAKAPYSLFRQASDNVRSGIIIGLGSRLQIFQNQLIRDITTFDEIDLELPGKQKCAYFLVLSDQDSAFDFLSSLFMSFLFIKLVRLADSNENGQLDVPVHIIGDEWLHLGVVHDFNRKISVIRQRRLSVSIMIQSIAGFQNRYPHEVWQEIMGCCDTTVFMGCTDQLTADWASCRAGESSIDVTSKAKVLGTWRISDYTPQYRETASVGRRKLLTPDECLRMPNDECLVMLRGQKVLKLRKFDYSKHPDAKKLIKVRAKDHVPQWVSQPRPHKAALTNAPERAKPKTAQKPAQPRNKPKTNMPDQAKSKVEQLTIDDILN